MPADRTEKAFAAIDEHLLMEFNPKHAFAAVRSRIDVGCHTGAGRIRGITDASLFGVRAVARR
jgi:hypothetical protein